MLEECKLIDECREDINCLEDQNEYLENQSRRNNIKILGVHEDKDKENTWDDTEIIVKDLIKKKLNYEDEIEIEWAHRVGKKHRRGRQDGSGKTPPRPIVVKISNWKVKETVLREARKIEPEGVMFYNDLAKRTLNRRTERIPEMVKY